MEYNAGIPQYATGTVPTLQPQVAPHAGEVRCWLMKLDARPLAAPARHAPRQRRCRSSLCPAARPPTPAPRPPPRARLLAQGPSPQPHLPPQAGYSPYAPQLGAAQQYMPQTGPQMAMAYLPSIAGQVRRAAPLGMR
jgi:hypothetical protein